MVEFLCRAPLECKKKTANMASKLFLIVFAAFVVYVSQVFQSVQKKLLNAVGCCSRLYAATKTVSANAC